MRTPKDFRAGIREGAWLLGCIATATAFCYVAPDYGFSPVPFFSASLYLLTGGFRLALSVWRKFMRGE